VQESFSIGYFLLFVLTCSLSTDTVTWIRPAGQGPFLTDCMSRYPGKVARVHSFSLARAALPSAHECVIVSCCSIDFTSNLGTSTAMLSMRPCSLPSIFSGGTRNSLLCARLQQAHGSSCAASMGSVPDLSTLQKLTLLDLFFSLLCAYLQPANGCVIVDPSTQRIIASGFDHSGRPPQSPAARNHGTIIKRPQSLGPDLTAERPPAENGKASLEASNAIEALGAKVASEPGLSRADSKAACRSEQGSGRVRWHPLKHAAIVAIDASAEADHKQFPDFGRASLSDWEPVRLSAERREGHAMFVSTAGPSTSGPGGQFDEGGLAANASTDAGSEDRAANQSVANPAVEECVSFSPGTADVDPVESEEKRRKLDASSCTRPDETERGVFATKPYLCTGFDAYLLREPCTM
jgi:hypothetical protein